MADYILTRTYMTDEVTLGELDYSDGRHICLTLENPDDGNIQGMSCIPPGTYPCIPHSSEAHPDTWEVTGVPGRSAILIHEGNTTKDTRGCILVGDKRGTVDGLTAVLNSRDTLDKLRGILPPNFTLEIRQLEDKPTHNED